MTILLNTIVILFSLIFLGYLIGKKGIIRPTCCPDLSTYLVNIALPVTVFCSMIRPFDTALLTTGAQMFIATILFHLGSFLLGFGIVKLLKVPALTAGSWIFACTFTNNGFMGFPLALSLYGQDGLFLMAVANVVSNFLIFSLGAKLLTMHYPIENALDTKKMLLNNINLAVVLGLFFYFAQIPVPETIATILTYIGNTTVPLSMLVVGLSISKSKVKDMFRDKTIYHLTLFRLLVIPFCVMLVFQILPFSSQSIIPAMMILMAALPAASSASLIAEQYGTNTQLAATAIFQTTLFSMLTIPLILGLMHLLGR